VYNVDMNSNIPKLIEQKGWSRKEFVARCALAEMSMSTAYRLARGSLNVEFRSLLSAAKVLEMNVTELIDEQERNPGSIT